MIPVLIPSVSSESESKSSSATLIFLNLGPRIPSLDIDRDDIAKNSLNETKLLVQYEL